MLGAGIAKDRPQNLAMAWLPNKKSKTITNTKIDSAVLNLNDFREGKLLPFRDISTIFLLRALFVLKISICSAHTV